MDSLTIINDPNFVPLAADQMGVCFITHEGSFIIVSSTLAVRTQQGDNKWLTHPTEYVRGGGRP